jgi:hypothetical protein
MEFIKCLSSLLFTQAEGRVVARTRMYHYMGGGMELVASEGVVVGEGEGACVGGGVELVAVGRKVGQGVEGACVVEGANVGIGVRSDT